MKAKTLVTYSQLSSFLTCRRKMKWRYVDQLVPIERAHSLRFGSLIHDCLERWHGGKTLAEILRFIDRSLPNHRQDDRQQTDWHHATAMMRGYAATYPKEDFNVIALEKQFEGPILNPKTGQRSRTYVFGGKLDGIILYKDGYYLFEHKTASQIDAAYLEKLWTDFQILAYAVYAEIALGIEIKGVLYNVLTKTKLKQKAGETQADFETRRAALIAKSKTGKSSAKRQEPESDESFQSRLAEKHAEPGMYHRELIYLTKQQRRMVRQEIWDLTQALLEARRNQSYLPNRAACFHYGRSCDYLPLCRDPERQDLADNLFKRQAPHSELATNPQPNNNPIF